MLQTIENHTLDNENKTKSNADIIAETYYEYHGKHDDGDSPADAFDRMGLRGVIVA